MDVLEDGELSCTAFVTRKVFEFFGLINLPHAMAKSAITDLKKSGWYEIDNVRPGAILFWEEQPADKPRAWNISGMIPHIGVYLGDDKAISHSDKERCPIVHHFTFGNKDKNKPTRRINTILWHEALDQKVK